MPDSPGGGAGNGLEFLNSPPPSPLCAYCRNPLGTEKSTLCLRCKTPYHLECWGTNGRRCAIYGCEPVERPAPEAPPAAAVREAPRRGWGSGNTLLICVLISGGLRLLASLAPSTPTRAPDPPSPVAPRPRIQEPWLRTPPFDLSPKDASFYVHRAIERHKAGAWNDAMADNDKAIELNPRLSVPFCNRGIIKVVKKDLKGALADFDEAIRLNPDYADAYRQRGYVKDSLGDLAGALADCTRAIQLNPEDGSAFRYRGRMRQLKGDLDGALSDYSQAVVNDPADHTAWSGRASVRLKQRMPREALADFTNALKANPEDPFALHHRGHTYCEFGDFAAAEKDFGMAIDHDPDLPKLFYDRACARYNQHAWQASILDFKTAAAKAPSVKDDCQIRTYFARARLGQEKEALAELRDYVQNRTAKESTPWNLESLRFVAGITEEVDYLARIPTTAGTPQVEQACEAYYNAGMIRLLHGDPSRAKEYYDRVLKTGATSTEQYKPDAVLSAEVELEALKKGR